MIKPLRIKNKDFSDSQIFKLANIGCTAAFAEYGLRAYSKPSINKKFDNLEKKFKDTYHLPVARNGYQRSKTLFNVESKKLSKIHKRAYEVPIRFLVNPLNTNLFNELLLSTSINLKIKDIVFKLNLNSEIELNNTTLLNTQKRDLKFSIVWLNWFLSRPAYKRPDAKFLNYYFKKSELNQIENYKREIVSVSNLSKVSVKKISSLDNPNEFIRLATPQVSSIALSLSKANISKLQRLFYIFKSLDVIQKDLLLFMPIYSILNASNYSIGMKLINKFFNIGYTRVLHGEIFSEGFLELLKDKDLIKELNQGVDF